MRKSSTFLLHQRCLISRFLHRNVLLHQTKFYVSQIRNMYLLAFLEKIESVITEMNSLIYLKRNTTSLYF